MNVTLEDISDLEKKMSIAVPAATVDAEFTKAFKYLQQNVEIKGFRKGKAPLEQIRKIYAGKVKDDVKSNIVQLTYFTALQEKSLNPIGMPHFQFASEVAEGQDFAYTAQFELQPQFVVKDLALLQVKKEKLEITDEKITSTMEQIRQSNATLQEVKLIRELTNGDFAVVDFKGFVDDRPLAGGEATDHVLELGSDSFIPGFEAALVGLKPEARKILNLRFPEDYHVADLRGKPVRFEVTIKGIRKKVVPSWEDSEFIKSLGNYSTLDEVKESVRRDLTGNEAYRIHSDLKDRVFKELIKANDFTAPKSLVAEQRLMLINDFRQRMAHQGMSEKDFADYQIKWDQDFTETAVFMVKSALLIQKIAEDHNLNFDQSDLEAKFKEVSLQSGVPAEKVREFYSDENRITNLQFQITEEKVLGFLLDKITVVEVAKDELPAETSEFLAP